MLKSLKIKNYALIEELEMNFYSGLSVITGETGAGKSILLGAISLILGKRSDTQVLKDKSSKCVVEGIFHVNDYQLQDFFKKHDLDYEPHTILRREVSAKGKSRAFINDTPVSLNVLKELGDKLVDIHSQQSTITLNDSDFQLAVVDNVAGITKMVNQYRMKFSQYKDLIHQLEDLKEKEQKFVAEKDYSQFLYDELVAAGLDPGEQKKLEEQLSVLTHAEEIKSRLFESGMLLSESDDNIIGKLEELKNLLSKVTTYHASIEEIFSRIDSSLIDLRDISDEINRLEPGIEYHPDQFEQVNNRLETLYRLEQKHRVATVEELLDIQDELHEKLAGIMTVKDEIEQLTASIDVIYNELLTLAGKISEQRIRSLASIEKDVMGSVAKMGIPDARVRIQHTLNDAPDHDGIDKIKFLFNANKGFEPVDLSSVASGGELSRLMLSIKSLISQKNLLPTIIFDEIDNGISGDVAGRVGDVLLQTAQHMQVIVITHLPQIAGKGSHHYLVFKQSVDDTTRTYMKRIDDEERVEEIAKMLSGPDTSLAARETAKELLCSLT